MPENRTLEERKVTNEEITMTMVNTTYPLSTDKVDITIKNNTSINYETGLDYSIEYFNGSAWDKIPLSFAVPTISIALKPQLSMDFSIDLFPDQYDYQQGRYRICKSVSKNENYDERYTLIAEFYLK